MTGIDIITLIGGLAWAITLIVNLMLAEHRVTKSHSPRSTT